MAKEIAEDPELPKLEAIIVGCWGEAYENDVQSILDVFVEQKEKFSHVKSLFIGDMNYEECEVSWIKQGDETMMRGCGLLPGGPSIAINPLSCFTNFYIKNRKEGFQ